MQFKQMAFVGELLFGKALDVCSQKIAAGKSTLFLPPKVAEQKPKSGSRKCWMLWWLVTICSYTSYQRVGLCEYTGPCLLPLVASLPCYCSMSISSHSVDHSRIPSLLRFPDICGHPGQSTYMFKSSRRFLSFAVGPLHFVFGTAIQILFCNLGVHLGAGPPSHALFLGHF